MATTSLNTARLRSQLLTSGLQQKDQPLFQVINSLIGAVELLIKNGNINAQDVSNLVSSGSSNQDLGARIPGMMGMDGEDGIDGMSIPGPMGLQGPAGIAGTGGPAGPTTIGPMGINGVDGDDGYPIPGPIGIQGIQGLAGTNGINGTDGFNGVDGTDGMDNFFGASSEFPRVDLKNTFRSLNSFKSYFSPLYDNGNSGASKTIDWNNGNDQYLVLDNNCTLTFSNPVDGGRYVLLIKGGFLITWPSSVSWAGGTTPTISGSTKHDLFTFMYKSSLSKYVGAFNLDYTL